jgi:hypothetical protein
MKNIYKYKLEMKPVQEIELPLIEVLDVQLQNGIPCLWAVVADNPDSYFVKTNMIRVHCFGTGTEDVEHNYHNGLNYISTVQIGGFVFHYFWE